jgi:hypothetical protein
MCVAGFLYLAALAQQSASTDGDNSLIIKSQDTIVKGSLEVIEGQMFTATCIANTDSLNLKTPPASLEWTPVHERNFGSHVTSVRKGNDSVVLTITRLSRSDAGSYKCVMTKADHEVVEQNLELHVKREGKVPPLAIARINLA